MGFEIDTGFTPMKPIDRVPDWFRDFYPEGTPDEKICKAYAYHIVGEMAEPARFETVRKHFLAKWNFIRDMADIDHAIFDEILAAYAERWLLSRE